MAVITSRNPGFRPETIRTRLARFMPSRTAGGWSVAWSSHHEHADEISDEHELQTAEHLGCYGSAVAHALAQAELTPQRLRLSAESTMDEDDTRVITIEVRAKISGPDVDPDLFDAIIHRAEPSCPVLRALASEVTIRLVGILDESLTSAPAGPAEGAPDAQNASQAKPQQPTLDKPAQAKAQHAQAKPQQQVAPAAAAKSGEKSAPRPATQAHAARGSGMVKLPQLGMPRSAPRWLSTRMAVLMVVAFGALASVPMMWHAA